MNGIRNNLLPLIVAGFIALAASGIGGLIVNYGWSKAAEEKLYFILKVTEELKETTKILFKIASDNTLTNVEQKAKIEELSRRVDRIEMKNYKRE